MFVIRDVVKIQMNSIQSGLCMLLLLSKDVRIVVVDIFFSPLNCIHPVDVETQFDTETGTNPNTENGNRTLRKNDINARVHVCLIICVILGLKSQ